jgi:hypothetical protein
MSNLPPPDSSKPIDSPKEKKKWYKKWWVWAIVVVLLAVASNSQSPTSETSGDGSDSAEVVEDTGTSDSDSSTTTEVIAETTTTTTSTTSTTTTTTTTIPLVQTPEIQKQFIAIIEDGRKKIGDSKTDLQKASALRDRDKALCAILSSYSATDWIGEIDEIGANGEGKAHLSITIADDIKVRTWNNAFSDLFDDTLIPESSPVFAQVLPLEDGNKIKFSAKFLRGRDTCLKQGNLTDFYYGREPEFIVQITNVELVK